MDPELEANVYNGSLVQRVALKFALDTAIEAQRYFRSV